MDILGLNLDGVVLYTGRIYYETFSSKSFTSVSSCFSDYIIRLMAVGTGAVGRNQQVLTDARLGNESEFGRMFLCVLCWGFSLKFVRVFNCIKPGGHYIYHYVQQSTILRSAHTVYLRVLCGSENKQRLFPYTTLTDCCLLRGANWVLMYDFD
jgi:hypothetical protein